MSKLWVLLGLLVLLLLACGTPATPLATATPRLTPVPTATLLRTPDLRATVQALVERQVAELLATTPAPTSTAFVPIRTDLMSEEERRYELCISVSKFRA